MVMSLHEYRVFFSWPHTDCVHVAPSCFASINPRWNSIHQSNLSRLFHSLPSFLLCTYTRSFPTHTLSVTVQYIPLQHNCGSRILFHLHFEFQIPPYNTYHVHAIQLSTNSVACPLKAIADPYHKWCRSDWHQT